MILVRVQGRGLIPRGYGLAPRLVPFKIEKDLVRIILNTPGLILECNIPGSETFIPVTKENCDRVYKDCSIHKPVNKEMEDIKDDSNKETTKEETKEPEVGTPAEITDTKLNENEDSKETTFQFNPMNKDDATTLETPMAEPSNDEVTTGGKTETAPDKPANETTTYPYNKGYGKNNNKK